MMQRRRFVRGALGALMVTTLIWTVAPLALAGGGGCFHSTPPSVGSGTTVDIVNWCYGPTVLHASPGDTITWTNRDPENHSVSGIGGTWGSFDPMARGDSVSYSFKTSGTYVYVCMYHLGMAGVVVVGDGLGAAGVRPSSVESAALAGAAPAVTATSAQASPAGIGTGTIVALIAVGLAGLAAMWAIRTDRRRRAVVGG